MRLQDILLTGMDIPSEAQNIFEQYMDTSKMTEDELKAFEYGATEAFRAVRQLIESDEHIVFHIKGHNCMEEFDLDELIEIIDEKEGYLYEQ